jgi:hypothetical protein
VTVGSPSRWRTFQDAPAWSLPVWLLICLALRVPAVLFADGFDYPDQQFQYVEPAWHRATGQALHRPWELLNGMRSEVYPAFLAMVFRGLRYLGVDEPMAMMRAVRAVHAVWSLLPMALFWLVVVRWSPLAKPRLPLLLFAASGLAVASVQPSAPTWATVLAVSAALALHGPRPFVFVAGLCLGLAFCGRFQDALFGPGFLAVLSWQRRWGAAGWFVAGCLPGIALQGLSDLATHGRFLATLWNYFERNVGYGASGLWREQPFWFYFAAGVVPATALLPGLLRPAWQRLRLGTCLLPCAVGGALVHLAAHSCIGRKALRFEYGALWMLTAVVAVGLPAATSRAARWHVAALFAVHLALFVVHSFWFGNAGAVQLANWLRERGDFDGHALVVGGDATSIGGFFYSRASADRVVGWAETKTARQAILGAAEPAPYVIAVRDPLDPAVVAATELELVATFRGQWDLRTGERRFVYRRRGS